MAVIASIISKFDEKGVRDASDAHDTLGSKLGTFGKVAGAAFAGAAVAAGAYAIKLGVDGVQAALEDEAAQKRLATSLRNTTGATDAQIASVEDWIFQQEMAFGVADDKLRPALDRLTRSTKNVQEAQDLTTLAMNISAGTGKDLETVANALAKAHDGSATALGKLGVGIDAASLKEMTFADITSTLSDTFANQASVQADTFQGKMGRLSLAFSEAKETVGSYIIDGLTPLMDLATGKVIPAITDFSTKLGKDLAPAMSGITSYVSGVLIPAFRGIWEFISQVLIPGLVNTFKPILNGLGSVFGTVATKIEENRDKLEPLFNLMKVVATFVAEKLAPTLGTVLGGVLNVLGKILGGVIDLFANLVSWISNAIAKVTAFVKAVADSPIGSAISGIVGALTGSRAGGGPVSSTGTYLVGENGPELFTPTRNGVIVPNGSSIAGGGTTVNVTVNGALDPVAVARQIQRILELQNVRLGYA